jgi:hypothetical protein
MRSIPVANLLNPDRFSSQNWQQLKKGDKPTLLQAFGFGKAFQSEAQYPELSGDTISTQVNQAGSGTTGASGGNLGNPQGGTDAQNQALGKQMAAAQPFNWTGSQWTALNNIVMAESGWNTHATNPTSGAYGIPQSLPGSKMASAGADWQTDARTQIAWMLEYIRSRYGTPLIAWSFHLANGWY